MCYWDLLCVVALWHPDCEFVIGGPLQAPPGTMFDNELLVLGAQTYGCTILGLHHSASNRILEMIHLCVDCHVGCLEHP